MPPFAKLFSVLAISLWLPISAFSAMVSPQVIYGTDDRLDYYQVSRPSARHHSDATVLLVHSQQIFPQADSKSKILSESYQSKLQLCSNEPFADQVVAGFCSGFLIAPDLVLTAGHCVRTQTACESTSFIFGFRVESAGVMPETVPTENVFGCQKLIHAQSPSNGADFAVVQLDREVTHVSPLVLRSKSGSVQKGDLLEVIGYPRGLPVKIASGASVRDVRPEFFVANLDTYGGNSGSAVFNLQTGEVEGILVRGEADYVVNGSCLVSKICALDHCRGEDVTRIDQVIPVLDAHLNK